MTTPIVLTGGTTVFGTAINNTGTDSFDVFGAGNTIVEGSGGFGGGNLIVKGGYDPQYGWDTQSTILLGNAFQTTDSIFLDGNQNNVVSNVLTQANVTVVVSGYGVSTPGGNNVELDNENGNTQVALSGTGNEVELNGNATNTIIFNAGGNSVTVGTQSDTGGDPIAPLPDDDQFGYTTSIKLVGSGNDVSGGDETFTITGGTSHNTIALGDGDNTIKLNGGYNSVTAWGGTNQVSVGGHSSVTFLGTDGNNGTNFVYDPDDPFAGPPSEMVTIAGLADKVTATYENVTINGAKATGLAVINLGNGNNTVMLAGNGNLVNVGDAANAVFLTGNGNTVNVTDPSGSGLDNVTTGNGTGDVVNFDHAGGSVNGTGVGTTTVNQAANATNTLKINMTNGTLIANVGNGNDTISAQGANSSITAGNGNDVVSANGAGTSVTLGNGNDTVTANGTGATVTVGSGNNNISATGTGSTVTVNAQSFSTDNITVGSNNHDVRVTNGTAQISGVAGDTYHLNGLNATSNLLMTGNNNMAFIGTDSSVNVTMNQAQGGNVLTVQADVGNTYSGTVGLTNFNLNDQLDLQGLIGANGSALNSYLSVLQNISAGPTSDTLHLLGGGSIVFNSVTGFTSSEFVFTSHTGPV